MCLTWSRNSDTFSEDWAHMVLNGLKASLSHLKLILFVHIFSDFTLNYLIHKLVGHHMFCNPDKNFLFVLKKSKLFHTNHIYISLHQDFVVGTLG